MREGDGHRRQKEREDAHGYLVLKGARLLRRLRHFRAEMSRRVLFGIYTSRQATDKTTAS